MYNHKRETPRPRYKCVSCDGKGWKPGWTMTITGGEMGRHGCYACGGKGHMSFASFEYYHERKPTEEDKINL